MTTALEVITSSARLFGAIGPIEALTSEEAADGLVSLNELLESLSNESLAIYAITQESFATVAGTASYTIGSGATWNTTRPLRIESAFIRSSSIDYPVRVLSREEYDGITAKTTRFMPNRLFYDTTVANGTVYLHGVPDAVYSLFLDSYKQLQSFAALNTAVVLPPGYKRMLRYNLAVEIAPEYGRTPNPIVAGIAMKSLAALKRLNARTPKLKLNVGALGGGRRGSSYADFVAGW